MSNQPIKKQSLSKNIIISTLYQCLLVVSPLLTAPYVSRVLHPSGVGIASYTQSYATFFALFAALGVMSYGTREIARRRDSREEYSKTFWEIELVIIASSLVCLACWLVFSFCYAEYKIPLLVLSTQIIAVLFDISWLYSGLEYYKYTVSINSLFKVASIVAIFLLVKNESDVSTYLLIHSASVLLGNISMWLFLPRFLCKTRIEPRNLTKHFKETMIYFVPAIASTIYTVLDKALIGLLIQGETSVIENGEVVTKKMAELESGYYEQATKIITIIKSVSFVGIAGVMTSRASYLYTQENDAEIKSVLTKTLNITSFLCLGACFGISAISSTFVPLFFGDGYDKTVVLLYILSSIPFIISISHVLGAVYYTPSGRRKQSAIYLIIGASINVALNIPFILLWKSIGAAIASLIAEAVISFLYFINCKGLLRLKELWSIVWKKAVAGLIMFALVFVGSLVLKNVLNQYALLCLQLVFGVVVYAGILLLMRDNCLKTLLEFVGKWKKKAQD